MLLYGLFDSLWLNTDVALCNGCTAVLQKPLDKGNVITTVFIDFSGIPLPEAMGANPIVTQVVANGVKLFLHGSFCNREDDFCRLDLVAEAVVLNVLLDHQRNGEHSTLAGLLLCYFQSMAVTIPYNVAEPQFQDVADPQTQIALQNQDGGNTLVGATSRKTCFHGRMISLYCSVVRALVFIFIIFSCESSYSDLKFFVKNVCF